MCAATGLVAEWHTDSGNVPLPDRAAWRVVSFVAAIIRRRGWMNELRNPLSSTIADLLREPGYVPAACYIAVESADAALAKATVNLIDDIEYRPLRYFQDERKASARNIAKTLVLAEETGFDWFFKDYLDPRFPVPNAGCAIVREVFAEWAALVRPLLTSPQIEKLTTMVEPYRATGEAHFYGVLTILSVLVPNAFLPDERLYRHSFAVDEKPFATWGRKRVSVGTR
jgi:hypothetical protein